VVHHRTASSGQGGTTVSSWFMVPFAARRESLAESQRSAMTITTSLSSPARRIEIVAPPTGSPGYGAHVTMGVAKVGVQPSG